MTPRYHPSDDRLLEYAAGALAFGPNLVIATHVRGCAACASKVAVAEAIGGFLLSALPPTPLSADALAHTLALIERPDPRVPARPAAGRPDWLKQMSPGLETAWRRRRWAAPGVWVASIDRGPSDERTYLLRVGAGMSVPRHTHRGAEMVCVLEGAFADRTALLRAGDFAESDDDVDHIPTVTAEGECVCLINTQSALVPRDWVGRLFQPLVRI